MVVYTEMLPLLQLGVRILNSDWMTCGLSPLERINDLQDEKVSV